MDEIFVTKIDVVSAEYPYLRFIASTDEDGYMRELISTLSVESTDDLVLTFD